ncbi:squamous cell carcinoma antigen recognized by T-cells 3-like [Argiope bruennichi]|uniref:Squamous cell carcinoma antigen recognized by like protein n=1 Tax=Argiope bruennichi TaxID=94029 RepID=A0A8T0FLG2_ARGBR|nr:squamous cell carcinoma antigen recognized by T-cells 3-like [Argiope bruennichi]KAF8792047.1 Squamous cell carcinoma antigen recognized by like protein [Argiope bruennichi]
MSEMDVDEEIETKEEDNFSNSAEGSSDDEDVDEENIRQKQKEIEANPYTYDLHVQLISLCRKAGDLDKLRAAREKMSELFPLTPELWLDWITDERKLATTKEQERKMIYLFKRALRDYYSVSIWLEFVQFSIGTIGESWDNDGLNNVRETFEKAATAVGIHVAQGCLIWEAYREFESAYLMYIKGKGASVEEIKDQEKRIFNLFKRQLSIPLLDMERTFTEFTEFPFEHFKPDDLYKDHAFNKALNKLKQLLPYEDALYKSEPPHYEEYKKYIQFEKDAGEPNRVQGLYERALIENCLKEELWLDYTKYMNQVIKIKEMALPVHERSVRNLPWCVQLWISYVRSLERYEEPHEEVIRVFETALGMGFPKAEDFKEFWLAYLSYLRRKLDEDLAESLENLSDCKEISDVYNRASTQMQEYCFGSESEYAIMKFWISFTARYKKDIVGARQLWRELIDHGHKEEARVWLDYANFERLHGDATHYRKLLSQAISCVSDWQETFVDLLLAFEQEEGSLESLEKAISKCETQMQHIIEKRMKKLEEAASYEKGKKQDKRKNIPKYQAKGSKSEQSSKTEESETHVQMDAEGFKIPPVPNKLHLISNSRHDSLIEPESEKRKRPLSSEVSEEAQESKKRKAEKLDSHGMSVRHDSSKDDRTVFISNLSFQTEEDKIQEFFSQIGELEEVRLVKDYKGRSKGFCYVVYKSQEHVKLALAKDREMLDGRPVLISPCEDRKNNPIPQSKFKFGTGLERNKLFIKGLPFSTTKEDLENMYKEYGSLKEVRIVTYRNGHSKGLAYVEFEDETAAANAVVKTDGTQIEDKIISVAISNPPPRKPKKEFSSVTIADSLGGGGGSSKGPRGRGRTQLSLLPRSVARSPAVKTSGASNGTVQNGQSSESMDTSEDKKPLSNSDFAKMLRK